MTLRPDLIEAARHARDIGGSWLDCLRLTGLSIYTLRCELEPGFRAEQLAKSKMRPKPVKERPVKAAVPEKPPAPPKPPHEYHAPGFTASKMAEPSPKPPQSVLFERERAMLAPRTLTAALCGDPPFERSALAKRGQ